MSAGITRRVVDAALDAEASGHLDGASLSRIFRIRDDFEIVLAREVQRVGIAGDERDRQDDAAIRRVQSQHHAAWREPIPFATVGPDTAASRCLAADEILDGNEDHGWSTVARAAAFVGN